MIQRDKRVGGEEMRAAIGILLSTAVAMGGGYFVSLNVAQGGEVVNSSAETKSQGR